MPADEDGYIGRLCSGCGGKFRMLADEYAALPDTTRLTCPYCGRAGESSDFLTPAQLERAEPAVHAVAEQYMHQPIDDMLGTYGALFSLMHLMRACLVIADQRQHNGLAPYGQNTTHDPLRQPPALRQDPPDPSAPYPRPGQDPQPRRRRNPPARPRHRRRPGRALLGRLTAPPR